MHASRGVFFMGSVADFLMNCPAGAMIEEQEMSAKNSTTTGLGNFNEIHILYDLLALSILPNGEGCVANFAEEFHLLPVSIYGLVFS